jgi:predicted lysophospholipase L1 biosynthesis ABC-type transport system permease subunit
LAAITHLPPVQRFWYGITLDCAGFENLEPIYYGGVYVDQSRLRPTVRSLRNRFPGIVIAETSDLLFWTQRLAGEAAQGLKISAVVVIALATCLTLALLRILHSFRVYEFAVLRMIGARPRTLLAAGVLEYLTLGGLAGAAGVIFGSGGTALVLRYVTGQLTWIFSPTGALLAIAATASVSVSVSLFDSWTALRPTPFQMLHRR